jgi:hypothetical protein
MEEYEGIEGLSYQTVHIVQEFSDWECELFGSGQMIVLTPAKNNVPNRFWRLMQYLVFGNKWRKKNPNAK